MDPLSQSPSARSKRSELQPATLSLADVAALLGCSYSTLNGLVREGRAPVPPLRIGHQIRFRKSEVRTLLGMQDDRDDEVTR